ncbi:ATG26 [Scenedesmus sp. PABB004]|nr:ATG26 [Scenedesmus sp. PABB004]
MGGGARRVVIVTSGSRGDVQPYVALGLELAARGHAVTVATEARGRALVEELGRGRVGFALVAGDPVGILFERQHQALLARGRIVPVMMAVDRHNRPFQQQALADVAAACTGADVVVSSPLVLTATLCAAQAARAAWVPVALCGVQPTGAYPSWALASRPFRWRALNRATYSLLFAALWAGEARRINAWRAAALGLPPLARGAAGVLAAAGGAIPVVQMATAHMLPGQAPPPDWPPGSHLTGFAYMPATPEAEVDPRLAAFVAAPGGPPLYLGLGSMPAPDPRAMLQLAVGVTALTGRRAVLAAGWSDLAAAAGDGPGQVALPAERLLLVPSAPHDWLLPRCCAAVHHAGVGTCGAVLRAGIPSVPCPVMLDQHFNSERLAEAGVACQALPFREVTAQALAARLDSVLGDAAMAARAAEVAREVAACGGVAAAADIILAAESPWEALEQSGKLAPVPSKA